MAAARDSCPKDQSFCREVVYAGRDLEVFLGRTTPRVLWSERRTAAGRFVLKGRVQIQRLCQHDFRMKERARDRRCDSDEITLSANPIHIAGLRKVGEVYVLAVAN